MTALLLAALVADLTVSRGRIVENVPTLRDPTQTYALYLPPAYDPSRRWPALLVFDPRGRAVAAAEVFRPAAERFGWVVLSSYDTRSDGPMEPNIKALDALWPEVESRYASDPARLYAAGFSGGGMLTLSLGLGTNGLAGVIDCGGRLPAGVPIDKARFAHYGAAGRADFNYTEMADLDARFAKTGVAHRLDNFDGTHEWMPAELAMRAVAWLEAVAMKAGTRPKDEAALRALLETDGALAAELEASGRLLEGLRLREAMLRTFDGLLPTDGLRAEIARLAKDPRMEAARKAQRKAETYEREALHRMGAALGAVRSAEAAMPLAAFRAPLRLEPLKKTAAGTGEEAEAARRVIESLVAQTSFYLPREFLEGGDPARAALVLEVAQELRPEAPGIAYNQACAWARLRNAGKALDALERAIALGFKNVPRLEADEDLASLRKEPRYRGVVERLRSEAAGPQSPPTPSP